MTQVTFTDDSTINVVAQDNETFYFKTYLPLPKNEQEDFAKLMTFYFEENFEDDKTSMVYWVLMKMMGHGLSFYYAGSDREENRKYIGSRIRELREEKGFEAKVLAKLIKIDAANISKIEQGRYSVGIDILSKIADALGVRVDFV